MNPLAFGSFCLGSAVHHNGILIIVFHHLQDRVRIRYLILKVLCRAQQKPLLVVFLNKKGPLLCMDMLLEILKIWNRLRQFLRLLLLKIRDLILSYQSMGLNNKECKKDPSYLKKAYACE